MGEGVILSVHDLSYGSFVNVKQGLYTGLLDHKVGATQDYHSITSISHNLPYMSVLAVFPLPLFKETLNKTNHIKSLVFDSRVRISISVVRSTALIFGIQGEPKRVPCHKVLYFVLGKAITRHIVCVPAIHVHREHCVPSQQ